MQGKEIISQEEYTEKLSAAIDARENKDFIIVARTDARATEGLDDAIQRGIQNKKTGADAIFVEAPRSLDEMKKIGKEINAPLVANMIEGGATPLSSAEILNKMGFKIILYPLSVLYANTFATINILKELKKTGSTSKYKQKVVNFDQFNDLVELPKFKEMEKKYGKSKRE
ncbi:MAG: isocitrate lyase/phosphoenolpyruvate mutase family protein [Nitrosopumilus sp.]|nr:isocitrate lyase/phosphoenolpyruvate mutase family protein [Nitrosopumilus sp.]